MFGGKLQVYTGEKTPKINFLTWGIRGKTPKMFGGKTSKCLGTKTSSLYVRENSKALFELILQHTGVGLQVNIQERKLQGVNSL